MRTEKVRFWKKLKIISVGILIISCYIKSGMSNEVSNEIVIKELGFSMKVPEGWKVGKPSPKKDKKWIITKDGIHCFLSEETSYPFGRVWIFSAEGFSSISEYAHTTPTLHGTTLQESHIKICGFDGIEIIGYGLGENRVPVKGIYIYLAKDDKFIVISFITTADTFEQYKSIFRASLKSIIIK
ncbi:MAG: hypothetical protein NC905_05630 [Candidatus Omnitrophica bacterium]|nr:hypothetical protein [Candidatus Omnitrophota bacterium]